jgi:hypothetical protein
MHLTSPDRQKSAGIWGLVLRKMIAAFGWRQAAKDRQQCFRCMRTALWKNVLALPQGVHGFIQFLFMGFGTFGRSMTLHLVSIQRSG